MEEYKGFQEEKEKEISDAETSDTSGGSGFDDKKDESLKPKEKQNWMAVIIILAGLLVGSVLVDIVQLVTGQGVSQKALRNSDIFELDGKTWVAYNDPAITVTVVNDSNCEQCAPDEALLFLRRYMPTILANEIEAGSGEGETMIKRMNIKTLPAFVFDSSIQDTMFYLQAQTLFDATEDGNDAFVLNTRQLGVPVGKYLELPSVSDDAARIGSAEDELTIVEYSDFQCPYCNLMHPIMQQVIEEFDGQISLVYKHLPLSFHSQAMNAALASECALEQDAFEPYADILFARQDTWGETEGTAIFKRYAQELRLSGQQFNTCLDSQKYADKVQADMAEAQEFGISGTPGFFIGEEFLGGAAQYETIKAMIEGQLSEQSAGSSERQGEETEMQEEQVEDENQA